MLFGIFAFMVVLFWLLTVLVPNFRTNKYRGISCLAFSAVLIIDLITNDYMLVWKILLAIGFVLLLWSAGAFLLPNEDDSE